MLIVLVGATLGTVYEGLVDRRLGLTDRRRWMALTPAWVLAAGMALALHTVSSRNPAFLMVLGFAGASLIGSVIDALRALWRRRTGTSTRRDDRVVPFNDVSA